MPGGHAYIDESTQNDYLVVCSVVASGDVNEVRKIMRGLVPRGQRSLHMKNEKKPQRQDLIVKTVCSLDLDVTVYCAKPAEYGSHSKARDACLQRAAADGVKHGIQRMVLDRMDGSELRDKNSIIVGSSGAGASSVPFTYDHMARHAEPLLWVPDVVGWFYARGGHWRDRVRPIVTIKNL